MNQFSERIKFLRNRKGLTQQELSDALGISRTAIAGYERLGKEPQFDNLIRIAQFFEVTVDYLLGLSNREIEQDSKIYFTQKIDSLFAVCDRFKQHGFSDSSFADKLYDITMKSFDYDLYYPISDAAFHFQVCFLELFDYIDKANAAFDDVANAEGLIKPKLKADFLKAKASHLSNDARDAMEELTDYCCELMEEGSLRKRPKREGGEGDK